MYSLWPLRSLWLNYELDSRTSRERQKGVGVMEKPRGREVDEWLEKWKSGKVEEWDTDSAFST